MTPPTAAAAPNRSPARDAASALMASPQSPIGDLVRGTRWEDTALGPVEQWPRSLRIAASICLNSRFPMFVWWGPSLINIYNDAYAPILGKRHPHAMGQPAAQVWRDIWEVLAPQVEAVMQRGEATWNERVRLVMERNGFSEDTYFTWSYSPILDDEGAIGGLFCACTEETARLAAQAERDRLAREAQSTAQTLQTWFDNAPGFVALLRGPDFIFEMVNQAYYQLVGHRPIAGRPVFDALPEVRDQGFQELLQGVMRTGVPYVGRAMRLLVQREPNGPASERFVDLVYQPVRGPDGAIGGIFVQGYDVTEQVAATQALREADRRKDEFLATLAHELRNPLAPVRQAVMVAKAPGIGPERKDWALSVIERQAAHMALLLDDLLDVSRISRGQMSLRVERTALATVVASAVETVRPLIERKRHALHIDVQPLTVDADPMRLAQVLSNLLSNAAKYTDAGGQIRLSAALVGHDVVIRVRDNGIGMTPEWQERVFEMFSQATPALDRAEGGLGIGLALSRGLVALHGGRIELQSEGPGRGCEFTVRLPAQAAPRAG